LVLLILCGNLALSMLIKAPCASGDWADGRQYIKLCYTDIVPLYSTEHLEGNRLPYLNACPANEAQCDEYPVLGMYVMRGAASIAHDGLSFFLANAIFLILAAFTIAIALYMAAGMRAVAFVVAPTLAIYAFTNWDLITVALATVATLLYLRKRDTWSGVMLGLGAAAKLYPALLVIPFVAGRFRQKEPDGGIHLAWAAAGTWPADLTRPPGLLERPVGWQLLPGGGAGTIPRTGAPRLSWADKTEGSHPVNSTASPRPSATASSSSRKPTGTGLPNTRRSSRGSA
jgi:uncharacterized membrane protein